MKILSNRRMMALAPTVTLGCFSLVLFLFMIGQGNRVRDLETKMQEQKPSDHEDKQSNDKPPLFWNYGHKDKQSNDGPPLFWNWRHKDKQSNDEPYDGPPLFWNWRHKDKQSNDGPYDGPPLFWNWRHKDKQSDDGPPLFWNWRHKDKQSDDGPPLFWNWRHKDKQSNDGPYDGPPLFWNWRHKDKQSNDGPPLFWNWRHKDKQSNDKPPLFWNYGHTDEQSNDRNLLVEGGHEVNSLEDHPSSNLDHTEAFKLGFFTLDDLHVGNVMTLQFHVQKVPHFLSKKEADSLPLSLSQLTRVLHLLSIPQDSPQAKSMRKTLEQCEEAPIIKGETRMCVNSEESMLEFVDTVIGSEVKHDILKTSNPSPSAIPLQNYTILEVSHDINASKYVSCHPIPYPYAIYGCHYIATGSKVFKVSLVGDKNGDKMEAIGMCHLDTSDWDPDHIIFKTLGIKPGKNSTACHFFPVNHLLWVPQQPSKSSVKP